MRLHFAVAAVLLAGLGLWPAVAQTSSAAPSCTTTTIPVNSSDTGNVYPSGVNSSDIVVGSFQDLVTFAESGFQWSGGTGTLYDYPGASFTLLGGINDNGVSVGTYGDSSGQQFGFFLSKNGQTQSFSAPGAYNTAANGINNFNYAVGTSQASVQANVVGFVKHGSNYKTIQYPGAVDTYPLAINDAGMVVGWYYDGSSEHGFAEYHGNYAIMEPPGSSSSLAEGINNNGVIVGEFRPSATADGEGFTYLNGKFTSYVYPSSSTTYTQLNGVNSLGDRVGDAITGTTNGFLTGPGFLLKCQ